MPKPSEPNARKRPISEAHVAFGARLAALRVRRSQREIALEAKIDHGTISDIENGYTDPKLSTLVQVARALGVSVEEIISERIQPSKASRDLSRDDRLAALEDRLAALSERMSARDVREAEMQREIEATGFRSSSSQHAT